jgi:DNA-directed RNA polymerase specialized sigma24 family protein
MQSTENRLTELAKAMYRKSRRNRNVPIDEHTADDIAQEAWSKLLEHGETDDMERTFRACASYAIREHDAQDQRFPQRCTPDSIDETMSRNALTLSLDDEAQGFEQLLTHIENVSGEDDKLFAACLALTDTFTQACHLWRIDRKQGYRIRDRILTRLGV